MAITEGTGSGEYNATIDHVQDTENANETVLNRPATQLENRTDTLKGFQNDLEDTLDNHVADTTPHGALGPLADTTSAEVWTNKKYTNVTKLEPKRGDTTTLTSYAGTGTHNGEMCFDTTANKLYIIAAAALKEVEEAAGGTTTVTSITVTQTAHGIGVHKLVYLNVTTGNWTLAIADNVATLATHFVVEVPDANTIVMWQLGHINIPSHGFSSATTYFLSSTTAGEVTTTVPSIGGMFYQNVFTPVSQDTIVLEIGTGYEITSSVALNSLGDVEITTPQAGDVLVYEAAASKFKNMQPGELPSISSHIDAGNLHKGDPYVDNILQGADADGSIGYITLALGNSEPNALPCNGDVIDSGAYPEIVTALGTTFSTEHTDLGVTTTGSNNAFGYTHAISANGLLCIVGATTQATGGAVLIYTRATTGSTWVLRTTQVGPTPASGDLYGGSVSISEDNTLFAVGAPLRDIGGNSNSGEVYLYTYDPVGYTATLVTTLQAATINADTRFGEAVVLSADKSRLIVGEPGYSSQKGKVSLYTINPTTYIPTKVNDTSAPVGASASCEFGSRLLLSADGSKFIVAAPLQVVTSQTYTGAIYGFAWDLVTSSNASLVDTRLAGDGRALPAYAVWGQQLAGSSNLNIVYVSGSKTRGVDTHYFGAATVDNYGYITRVTTTDYFGSSITCSPDGSQLLITATDEGANGTIFACNFRKDIAILEFATLGSNLYNKRMTYALRESILPAGVDTGFGSALSINNLGNFLITTTNGASGYITSHNRTPCVPVLTSSIPDAVFKVYA